MNKLRLISFIFALLPVFVLAQAVQPCIVKQYNQKETKTPLAGVQVEVLDANTQTSDALGLFTLTFNTMKPGDHVITTNISKNGYEIFNTSAVEQWTISRNQSPFLIVLVRSEYMAELKKHLTETSWENYRIKYQQAKQELEKEKEAGKLKEAEFNKQFNFLEEQYKNALKDLNTYLDKFARIDLSEISADEQSILEMVQHGHINEAVEAYEVLDISKKLLQERADLRELNEASKKIEEEKTRKQENISKLEESLKHQITTLRLAGGTDNFAKIGQILKEQALADTTDYDRIFAYAYYAQDQNDFLESELFYLMALNACGDNIYKKFSALNNLTLLYAFSGDHIKAVETSQKAMELAEQLLSVSSIKYLEEYVSAINGVGLTCDNTNDKMLFYQNALNRLNQLSTESTSISRKIIEMNLAGVYKEQEIYDTAEKMMLSVLEYINSLKLNLEDNDIESLTSWENLVLLTLGDLYRTTEDYSKAEFYLCNALESYMELSQHNPTKFIDNLLVSLLSLGCLYDDINECYRAEEHYLEALETYHVLLEKDPINLSFRKNLASCQYQLGKLYLTLDNLPLSKRYLCEAIENIKIVHNQDPTSQNRETMAVFYRELGQLYVSYGDTLNAELCWLAVLEHISALFSQDSDTYRASYAKANMELLVFYGDVIKDYEKAIHYGYLALDNLNRNQKDGLENMVTTQTNLGHTFFLMNNNNLAEHYLLEAFDNCLDSTLLLQNPIAFHQGLLLPASHLCNLYLSLLDFDKAEKYLILASDCSFELFKANPSSFRQQMLKCQKEVLQTYFYFKRLDKIEHHLKTILSKCTDLYKQKPDTFRQDIAWAHHNFVDFYYEIQDYNSAATHALSVLDFYTILLLEDMDSYCSDAAILERFLGDWYRYSLSLDTAENYYNKAVSHYNWLCKQDIKYCIPLSTIQETLGQISQTNQQFDKAVNYYISAWESKLSLLEQDSSTYCEVVNDLELTICDLLKGLNKYEQAEKYYLSAIEHCLWLYKQDPNLYESRLAIIYLGLKDTYVHTKNYKQAIKTIDKAITIYPNEPLYYDSKGEILLMSGDEQGALEMWRKVLELDPDFLKHLETNGGESELYKQLKENGLVE